MSYSRHWPYVDSGGRSRASSTSNLPSTGRYSDNTMSSSSRPSYSSTSYKGTSNRYGLGASSNYRLATARTSTPRSSDTVRITSDCSRIFHVPSKINAWERRKEFTNSTSSLLSSSSSRSSLNVTTRSAYDSGMRSYSSARALNDSNSNSYGNRYGSSYEPSNRYTSSAASSTRYGGSASAVDRYSSPVRAMSPAKTATSYSSLGRYGSGDVTPTNYHSANDYGSTYPSRSYSYSSGLAGSNNNYSPGNAMSRSAYVPGSYARPSDYGSKYGTRRSEDYGTGSSRSLYTSLADAHTNIVGRRQSLGRADSIKVSSTPPTPTESVAPSWREHSLGALNSDSKPFTETLKVDTYSPYQPGFTLSKPSLPSPIAEGSPSETEDKAAKDLLDAEDEFNRLYDRYVTHSPIREMMEKQSEDKDDDKTNGEKTQVANEDAEGGNKETTEGNNENADDSAYSSRMEESGTTCKDSETMSQSRSSENGQDDGEEIEYEAEEMDDAEQEKQDEASETEKEEQKHSDEENSETEVEASKRSETRGEENDKDDGEKDKEKGDDKEGSTAEEEEEEVNEGHVSGKACLDVEPPWAQFTSSFEEDEEEEVGDVGEADDEEESGKWKGEKGGARWKGEEAKVEGEDKERSMEPNQSMVNSMYESSQWPAGEEEEEEEESNEPMQRRKQRRMMMTFADAIKRRCEEVTGSVDEEVLDENGEVTRWKEPVAPSDCWQQFSFYDDDGEGEEAEGEEEANEQVPPWQQFIDYTIPPKSSSKYLLQVKSMNESESECTSDEEGLSQIRHGQNYGYLLAPPKDSGAETSSEVESDYEANTEGEKKRHFRFLPPEEVNEERGRVEDHLAQPAPVFTIRVTYDSDEEESVGTVSDFEDISDDEEEDTTDDKETSPDKEATLEPEDKMMTLSVNDKTLDVPQIMVTSSDEPPQCTVIECRRDEESGTEGSSEVPSAQVKDVTGKDEEKVPVQDKESAEKVGEKKDTEKDEGKVSTEKDEEKDSRGKDEEKASTEKDQEKVSTVKVEEKSTAKAGLPEKEEEKRTVIELTVVRKPVEDDQEKTTTDAAPETVPNDTSEGTKTPGDTSEGSKIIEDKDKTIKDTEKTPAKAPEPEIVLDLHQAKQVTENVPGHRLDRYYPKKDPETKAILRIQRGVSDVVRQSQVEAKVAPVPEKKREPTPTKDHIEPSANKKQSASKESSPSSDKKEALEFTKPAQYASLEKLNTPAERVDFYNAKKPQEVWARKSVVPDAKLSTALPTHITPEIGTEKRGAGKQLEKKTGAEPVDESKKSKEAETKSARSEPSRAPSAAVSAPVNNAESPSKKGSQNESVLASDAAKKGPESEPKRSPENEPKKSPENERKKSLENEPKKMSAYEEKMKEQQQKKEAEEARRASQSGRRGSGLVEAMASKFKTATPPPLDNRPVGDSGKKTAAQEQQQPSLSTMKAKENERATSKQNQRSLGLQVQRSNDAKGSPDKRSSSHSPSAVPAAPEGPSFEEQMDELRKKIKAGSSQLSQQVKDMSKGITDAKLTAKLAAELSNTKGLVDEAANLRQMVSKQYDQWKSTSEKEAEKREKEAQRPVSIKKIPTADSVSKSTMNNAPRNEHSKTAIFAVDDRVEKPKPKDEPVKKTIMGREPGKVASPFADKVKKEAELVKAAMEEQARRDAAKKAQQQKLEEQQKQQKSQAQAQQIQQQQQQQRQQEQLQQQRKQQQQQQQQQRYQQQQEQMQQFHQALTQKSPMESTPERRRSQYPGPRRHEPEGESDHDVGIRKPYGQRGLLGQQIKTGQPGLNEQKRPEPAQELNKAKEPVKKQVADLIKTKFAAGDLPDQGSMPGKGQMMGKQGDIKGRMQQPIEPAPAPGKQPMGQKMTPEVDKQKRSKTVAGKKSKKWRRRRPCRFIGEVQDVDELLNGKTRNRLATFDQFELMYQNCSRDKRTAVNVKVPGKGGKVSKIFVGDTKNVDDLYTSNDLRTMMGMFSPTSKVTFNFDADTTAKMKIQEKFKKAADGGGKKIDESTFQVYRSYEGGQGDYGTYLDSDLSLTEQPDELAVLKDGKRTSLVLRTQLSVRVHLIIEKLLNSSGRELRRALFSLKQIFQDDKDLVHEFVQNDGLACLIKVGAEADQNYQNYILRAIGQVMLYVDGMNGCIAHNETIQWLYSLLASPFRLVVKTALKLLLVFVEYTESNSLLLLAAVYIVDKNRGSIPWSNLVQVLTNKDSSGGDLELLIYAMTLLNTTLAGIPDQDTYYDIVDALEEQGMEEAIRRLSNMGNQELTDQCRLYEAVLREEDGTPDDSNCSSALNSPAMNIAKMRQTPRTRAGSGDRKSQRRKSDRSTPDDVRYATSPRHQQHNGTSPSKNWLDTERSPSQQKTPSKIRAPPALQKVEGQRPQLQPQQETPGLSANKRMSMDLLYKKSGGTSQYEDEPEMEAEPKKKTSLASLVSQEQAESYEEDINANLQKTRCPPPALPDFSKLADAPPGTSSTANESPSSPASKMGKATPVGAVHSLADRFHQPKFDTPPESQQQSPASQQDDDEPAGGNAFANALARARKGMDKKLATRDPVDNRKESDIQWEQAVQSWKDRPLIINNLDFTELDDSDDQDPVRLAMMSGGGGGSGPATATSMVNPYTGVAYSSGPPPPPSLGGRPPPPPPGGALGAPPPPRLSASPTPMGRAQSPSNQQQKDTKTVKLFWKEAQMEPLPGVLDKKGAFWQKVKPVNIDVEKLNQLFETKTVDRVVAKKKDDVKSELRILDTKRSNAINIGLKKLPPPGAIRTAITKFDSSILNKEGIEKILTTMMPTEEEKERIAEAAAMNPDVNLGEAEKFLLMLGEIPQLHARLRLWLFMLDYSSIEKDAADPLMDLKLAMEELDLSKTFQYVMATLLAVGNYLNGAEVKGFQLDYLAKVPEVKDTVHKYSLVYHLCTIVMEKFPDATDLYSELGAVVRCARFDFDEIDQNLQRLEKDCRSSWDYLRLIAKHESQALKQKMSEFLTECAQRILVLKTIHRRVINRFRRFLLYMGMPQHSVKDTKVNTVCKTIAEFALEYRTCRDKQQQQKKRQLEKRERNKTRGKLITETRQPHNGAESVRDDDGGKQHDELSRVLRAAAGRRGEDDSSQWTGSFPGARLRSTRHPASNASATLDRSSAGGQESPDDEILDGLVKAATVKTDPSRVEQRRKARQFNRKSLRRTRTLKLVEDQVGGE